MLPFLENLQEDDKRDPLIRGTSYKVDQTETNDRIRLQIPSMTIYLQSIRDLLYRLCLQHGCSLPVAFDLKLIVGEALTNIIKHSYSNRDDGAIFIDMLFYRSFVELRFRDFAPFNTDKKPVAKDLTEFRENGLGLYLITQISDYHYFDRSNGTLLVVKKRIQ